MKKNDFNQAALLLSQRTITRRFYGGCSDQAKKLLEQEIYDNIKINLERRIENMLFHSVYIPVRINFYEYEFYGTEENEKKD